MSEALVRCERESGEACAGCDTKIMDAFSRLLHHKKVKFY